MLDQEEVALPGPMLRPHASVHMRYPTLIWRAVRAGLVLRPAPPGDQTADGHPRLRLPRRDITIEATDADLATVRISLEAGALTRSEADAALRFAKVPFAHEAPEAPPDEADWTRSLEVQHRSGQLGLVAIRLIDRAQKSLLDVEPLTEVHVRFSDAAKAALVLGWTAIAKRGAFPILPRGARRFEALGRRPHGALHFVSASDLDDGYVYTMGIAQAPEAQAQGTMDVTFGLDGELIVPGQAVSPIPPFLALATRLFGVSVPTSSNISEEVQSIPLRKFAHPTPVDDLEPRRGGRLSSPVRPRNADEAITDLRMQISRFRRDNERRRRAQQPEDRIEATMPVDDRIGAAFDVTGMGTGEIVQALTAVLDEPLLARDKELIALYLDVESTGTDRVGVVSRAVDAARELGLKYVAVADDVEDSWLPNLLEYVEPWELNAIADYSDAAGVIVVDGRPVDPTYTAATAAQRIQSVFNTLSVDVLKMGMWLCLDALTARRVWHEILSNPHIPAQMVLMPIGIIEPWSAFVDNRDPGRTPRAILDPFEKIMFMIEEAEALGMPSLLTDTRHKAKWVLLGAKRPGDEPHVREEFMCDHGEVLGRTPGSAIPLLSWHEFMACERRARRAGILLGQAGSVEIDQLFRIISDTTYDAALEGRNPATAIWTAETERVLRTGGENGEDLQALRSATVSPFLAVVNRGYESHAKLDGWLRYLADAGRGDPALRQRLENQRARLQTLLVECLQAGRHDPSRYQQRWDAFRTQYLAYHDEIRDQFVRVRDAVADAWRTVPALKEA